MAKRVQRVKRATAASTTKKKPVKKATTRSQVQANKKKAAAKKAPAKKPVRGERAAKSAANQKAKRNVGKTVRAAERQARAAIGDKAFNMQERVADRNVKTLKSKPAPKTPAKKGAAKSAVTRKQNAFKKAAGAAAKAARTGAKSDAVKPTTRAAKTAKSAAKLGKLARGATAGGLAYMAADAAGLTPKLTETDKKFGRRTQEVQKKAAAKKPARKRTSANPIGKTAIKMQDKGKKVTPKAKPLKKEVIKPKQKPVNIGNVPKKPVAAAKPVKKAEPMKNVLRDRYGNPVRSGDGSVVRTNDYSTMTQEEIDNLFN